MSVARAQIMKAKELARELYIHTGRVTTQVCWDDALRFVRTLDELAASELASTTENTAKAVASQGHWPVSAPVGAGRFLVERESVDGGYVRVTGLFHGSQARPLSEVEAENAEGGL